MGFGKKDKLRTISEYYVIALLPLVLCVFIEDDELLNITIRV